MLFQSFSPRAKMETILLPCLQRRLLCICPLNRWAKKMGPAMVAWPERCQAAVPSQPFSELFVISRAQSDSQRQMVLSRMVVAGNLGVGLINHGNAWGLPRLGHDIQIRSPWTADRNGNLSFHSYRQFYFNANHSERPRIIAFPVRK